MSSPGTRRCGPCTPRWTGWATSRSSAGRGAVDLAVVDTAESDVLTAVEFAALGFWAITQAPPMRARLLKVSDTESVLVFVVHHIAADGFSMAPLTRDVMIAYAARAHAVPTWTPLTS